MYSHFDKLFDKLHAAILMGTVKGIKGRPLRRRSRGNFQHNYCQIKQFSSLGRMPKTQSSMLNFEQTIIQLLLC